MRDFGKLLIALGTAVLAIGLIVTFFERIPLIGKLPGDILIRKRNFTLYVPLATSLLLSAVISLIIWLFSRR